LQSAFCNQQSAKKLIIKMRDYKKYDIWKLSHLLTLEVYRITESFPKEEINIWAYIAD